MKTEKLIHQLVTETQPIKPLAPPLNRFFKWVVFAFVYFTVAVYFIGARPIPIETITHPAFLFQIILILSLVLTAAISVFFLTIPNKQSVWLFLAPIALLMVWTASIAIPLFSHGDIHAGAGLKCLRNILIVGMPPGVFLFYMLRRTVILNLRTVGFLFILTTTAVGCLGTRFICRNEDPLHFLIWHYMPVILSGSLGALTAHVVLLKDYLGPHIKAMQSNMERYRK